MGDESSKNSSVRIPTQEGSLEAPTRHSIDWQTPSYYNQEALNTELERVFDICHGCRRCVNLCQAFPTLFDLVDESPTMELDGVDKSDYLKVVDQCYLCDMCYMTKCPYVPPHPWNVDFPHLMLRAKAVKFKQGNIKYRDKFLTNTDVNGRLITALPLVDKAVNAANSARPVRALLEKTVALSKEAQLPKYHHRTARKRIKATSSSAFPRQSTELTTGKVAFFHTCYGNYNQPELAEAFFKVFEHNHIQIDSVPGECCCGMPKLELGDLNSVQQLKERNIPVLAQLVDQGYDIIAPVPSCTLMFKQEIPLLFPGEELVTKVQKAFFDPFEYLMLRHKAGLLNTDFTNELGDISYHVACHLRVQNIGLKTRDLLTLVPGTRVEAIQRCSGHDGTYAVKSEYRKNAVKIARPIIRKLDQSNTDVIASDCPMAATHIASVSPRSVTPVHPIVLLCHAYGLTDLPYERSV